MNNLKIPQHYIRKINRFLNHNKCIKCKRTLQSDEKIYCSDCYDEVIEATIDRIWDECDAWNVW